MTSTSNEQQSKYDCSIYSYLRQGTLAIQDAKAVSFMYKHFSYAAFDRHVRHMAATLYALGVREGDVVTLCVPNVPASVAALYAISYLGAVGSILHPLTPPESTLAQMQRLGSRVLVAFDKLYMTQQAVLGKGDIDVLLLSAAAYFSPVEAAVIQCVNRVSHAKLSRIAASSPMARVHLYRSRSAVLEVPMVPRSGQDVSIYLHSGGTTGVPKTIPVTNLMLNAESDAVLSLTQTPVPNKTSMLMVLPIFHGFGVSVCLTSILPGGMSVVLQPAFDPNEMIRLIKRQRVSLVVGVPTMFEKMLATGRFKGRGLRYMQNAYCGGDLLSGELKARFDEAARRAGSPCRLYQGYGLTETVAVCCANNPFVEDRGGSLGKPCYGVEMCVMDEDGNPLADGQRGEICVSGPTVMTGYLEDTPEGVLTSRAGKQWLHTGDCGYRDADGYYYFVGRKKRMSIIAGVNVYHQELEQLAREVEGVASAAVTELVVHGKVSVKLWLVPQEGAAEGLDKKVLGYMRSHLTKYCVPRAVAVIDQMPLTPMGKIDYRSLAARDSAQ